MFLAPSNTRRAPRRGRCPLTLAHVLAGCPGGRGGACDRAPELDGARPARLLRVTDSPRPLARAARALCPPVPALARALPCPRPDAHVTVPGPGLPGSLARTSDCERAPDPRAGGGRPRGDQRLNHRGPALPRGCPRALPPGRWERPQSGTRGGPRGGVLGS